MIAKRSPSLLRQAATWLAPPAWLVFRGPRQRREIALTFDDGPEPLYDQYLDVLDRHGARATFFLLGKCCAERPDAVLEMVRRGHEVCGHSFTHRRFPLLSPHELDDELDRTAALLPVPSRRRPLVRPPGGGVSMKSLWHCARRGYTTVMWSLDSDDCRTQAADEVLARVAPERVRAGEIVLLHEGQSWTLAALPKLIEGLTKAGYALVTVSELLR